VSKRNRSKTKTNSKSKSIASALPPRWTLFGQPQLLVGEDAADYDQLLARVCAVVKPVDIFRTIFPKTRQKMRRHWRASMP
jgi:hypothetical protein